MLTATLGAQCMLWQTSPAATEIETRVLDWLRQMIGLPEGFTGVIQDSASSATLCAVLVARERATDWQANADGLGACPPLAFYASEEAHSSVEKAVTIAGLGRQQSAPDPDRRRLRDAARRARRGDPRRPGAGHAAGGRGGEPRHAPASARSIRCDRSARSAAPRALSACRCRLGRQRAPARGAALDDRGRRARRQLRVQPAQVAADQLRLLGPFRARSGRAGTDALDPAGLPTVARERRA